MSSHYFGQGTSYRAVLMALLKGLEIFQELSLRRILVEMDSLSVVTAISQGEGWPWKYHYQFHKVLQLLPQLQASISHVYRERNAVADSLARLSTTTFQSRTYHMQELPSYIKGGLTKLNSISLF